MKGASKYLLLIEESASDISIFTVMIHGAHGGVSCTKGGKALKSSNV
jgi:hypothetical protein